MTEQQPRVFFRSQDTVYLIKCILGLSICYLLYLWYPQSGFYWSIITVVMVFSPDHSNTLAFDRMRATAIGTLVGVSLFFIHRPNLAMIALGITITIIICTYLQLENSTRSALAAQVIVMLNEKTDNTWATAITRMVCVYAGCIIAVVITLLFNYFLNRKKSGSPQNEI